MGQQDYIKDIARFGLENDQEKLLSTLTEFIEHNKNSKKGYKNDEDKHAGHEVRLA